MKHFIYVENEIEGRNWCLENGYIYCGTRQNSNFEYVMAYEDNQGSPMSLEEEEYYLKQLEKEEKKQTVLNEVWVIASDDGVCSRMYRSKSKGRKDCYTFYLSEAKKCTKLEAQKVAAIMTQRSKVGRVWFGLQIK